MREMKRPQLKSVTPLTDFRIELTFINEDNLIVDFKPLFEVSKRLAPLQDAEAFAKGRVDEWGWIVEWPELDIQIGADTLWLDAQAQNAPDENARTFVEWRARFGLSLKQAAKALGMTPRTMSAYTTGKRSVPRYIALACKGWEGEQIAQERGDRSLLHEPLHK